MVTPAVEPSIVLEGATKHFEDTEAVTGVSFAILPGQIFGLIGPSGSGKTTTVLLVTGVHKPDEGRVWVLGKEPRHFDGKTRARLGYMPQHFVLYPELTVRENLDFIASCYGVPLWRRSRRLDEMLELVELGDARKKRAGEISGGMQRRLQLACTLVHDPQVIVVDEPTAGVDPVLRKKFWDYFRGLRDRGRTVLVTTQYVTESEYCDVVAALQRGRLVAQGPPEVVRREAMGGEIVDVSGDGLSLELVSKLEQTDGVRAVQLVSPHELRVTVDDAGAATTRIVEELRAAGATVENVSQYQPNFDEVFVRLMESRELSDAA